MAWVPGERPRRDNYTVRSRRGWGMTELYPEFASIPIEGVFDGERVGFSGNGLPAFDRISRRISHGKKNIPVAPERDIAIRHRRRGRPAERG